MKHTGDLGQYLEEMPAAYYVVQVDKNTEGQSCTFVWTYANKALHQMMGKAIESLKGSSNYDFFHRWDGDWLDFYSKTAYEGISQNVTGYDKEREIYFSVSTYQTEPGYCGCVLNDITKQVLLEMRVEQSRERNRVILQNTTDAVFLFDLDTRTIYNSEDIVPERQVLPEVSDVPYGLLKAHLITEDSVAVLNESIHRLQDGEKSVSCNIQGRLNTDSNFSWHSITFSENRETNNPKKIFLGFLRNVDDEVRQREELMAEAHTDGLTGLYNVKAGRKSIEKCLAEQEDETIKNAFFMFDLDNFKTINDSKGHDCGDQVLVEFSKILRRVFRKEDIVYRLGGDEFAVFICDIWSVETVKRICVQLKANIRRLSKKDIHFQVSGGIFIGNPRNTYCEYYKTADSALYEMKAAGKNGYKIIEKSCGR